MREEPTSYHIQLRRFPHNHCRFNLSAEELRAIAGRWARDEWVELEGRRWSPHEAKLTILAGPRVEAAQLTMGRGWRNAERSGEDVTRRVLEEMRGDAAWSADGVARREASAQRAGRAGPRELGAQADALALELLSLASQANGERVSLSQAYTLAHARLGDRPASERLALAELAVRSLLARGLIEILRMPADSGGESGDRGAGTKASSGEALEQLSGEDLETVLSTLESWVDDGSARASAWVRRA